MTENQWRLRLQQYYDMETFIITILSLLIGYAIGRGAIPTKEQIQETISKVVKDTKRDNRVGAVRTPTAQELFKRSNPLRQQSEEVMRQFIRKDILNE